MKIGRLTKNVFDNHLSICSQFIPGYFYHSLATPPSADYLRRIMFYSEKRNISFLLFDENNAKIIAIILFHLFDTNSNSMNLEILLLPAEFSAGDIAKSIKTITSKIINAYHLNSFRCTVADFEEQTIRILEEMSFSREVHYKEHIFADGKRHDAFLYSIYGGPHA